MEKDCYLGDPTLTKLYVITDNDGGIKPIIWLGNSKRNVQNFPEGIYVLNAFQKKTEKTPQLEILRARKQYAKIRQKYF